MCFFLSVFIFFFFFQALSWNKFHFLSLLVIFELGSMAIFLIASFFLSCSDNVMGCYLCYIYLVFCAVEAVLGLALVVSSSRSVGDQSIKFFSFLGV